MGLLASGFKHWRRERKIILAGRPLAGSRLSASAPFFIVGSGRCGSTLLRAVLMINDAIHIPPETYILRSIIDEYRLFNRLPWTFVVRQVLSRLEYQKHFAVFGVCLRDLYQELVASEPADRTLAHILDRFYMYHAAREKPTATRWGDKTPTNAYCLGDLSRVFPDMRVIHMVRDGRDVVTSFVEMQEGLGVTEAVERWLTSIAMVRQFAQGPEAHCLEVRYEDIVHHPEMQIRKVCEFIEADFDHRMLRHHETAAEMRDIATYDHYRDVMSPISGGSIGKWRDAFDGATKEFLNEQMGEVLSELGYM